MWCQKIGSFWKKPVLYCTEAYSISTKRHSSNIGQLQHRYVAWYVCDLFMAQVPWFWGTGNIQHIILTCIKSRVDTCLMTLRNTRKF